MNFQEALKQTSFEDVLVYLIREKDILEDAKNEEEQRNIVCSYYHAYEQMLNLAPNTDIDKCVLKLDQRSISFQGKEKLWKSVSAVEDGVEYSIIMVPWDRVLSYPIQDETLNKYGVPATVAEVLWEATDFSFEALEIVALERELDGKIVDDIIEEEIRKSREKYQALLRTGFGEEMLKNCQ